METYASGFSVSFSVDVLDNDEVAVADATAITMKVYDKSGLQIGVDQAIAPALIVSGTLSLTTLASYNTIVGGGTRDARLIKLYITRASGGTMVVDHIYAIQLESVIAVMTNSYQTYQSAEVIGMDMPNLDEWDLATESEKHSALIEAYNRIGQINFEVDGVVITDINAKTADEFSLLSANFLNAMRRAQVIEANSALGNNVIADKRESGLMSETIGESSNMYRPGKPVLVSTSRKALNALTGYVKYGVSIGRA